MTSPSFTLPQEIVDAARKEREDAALSSWAKPIDDMVRTDMRGLETVAGGFAQQLSPFAQALQEGGLKVPTLEDLSQPTNDAASRMRDEWERARTAVSTALMPTQAYTPPGSQPSGGGMTGSGTAMPGDPAQPAPASMPTGGPSPDEEDDETYIRRAAAQRGIDPETAVRVANTEGGANRGGRARQNMEGAPAFGHFQLYVGGAARPAMGDEALAAGIDPRDPKQWRQSIDFALDRAKERGWQPFQGAAAAGIGNWDGIGQNAAPGASSAAPRGRVSTADAPEAQGADLYPRQDLLDDPDKWAVCGPLGIMAFAAMKGQPIDYQTAKEAARKAGWRPGQGMAGPESQVAALNSIGVASKLGPIDLGLIQREVRNGNPVGLSSPGTSGHYFTVQGVDEQGRLDLGNSALSLRASGGKRWFTVDELRQLGPIGNVTTAIYLDNPASPTPSVAAGPNASAPPPAAPAAPLTAPAAAARTPSQSAGAASDMVTLENVDDGKTKQVPRDQVPTWLAPVAPGMPPSWRVVGPVAQASPLDAARATTSGGETMVRQSLGQPVPMPGAVDEQATGGVPGLGEGDRSDVPPSIPYPLRYPVDVRERGEQPYDATDAEGLDRTNDPLVGEPMPQGGVEGVPERGDVQLYRQPLVDSTMLSGNSDAVPQFAPGDGGVPPTSDPVYGPPESEAGPEVPASIAAPDATTSPPGSPYEQTASPGPDGLTPIYNRARQIVGWLQDEVNAAADEFVNGPKVGGPNDSLPLVSSTPGEPDYQSPVTRVQAAQQASQQRRELPIGERLAADVGGAANLLTGAPSPEMEQAGTNLRESIRSAGEPIIRPVEQAIGSAAGAVEQAVGAPAGTVKQAAEDVSNFFAPVAAVNAGHNVVQRAAPAIAATKPPNLLEAAQAFRYSWGMLGNPATGLLNAVSGPSEIALGLPVAAIKTGLLEGRPLAVVYQAAELTQGLAEGVINMLGTVVGVIPRAVRESPDYRPPMAERMQGPVGKAVGYAIDTPGRITSQAPDALFSRAFERWGRAQVISDMLDEAGVSRLRPDQQAAEIARLSKNPTPEEAARIAEGGRQIAKAMTYRADPGKIEKHVSRLFRPGERPATSDDPITTQIADVAGSFLQPFFTAVWQYNKRGMTFVPGLGSAIDTKVPFKTQAARQVVGAGLIIWAADKASQGMITGPGPADTDEAANLRAQGIEPNSVLIPGLGYVSTDAFGPAAPILRGVGAYYDSLRYATDAEKVDPNKRGERIVKDQLRAYDRFPVVQAMKAVYKMAESPIEGVTDFAASVGSSFVPAAVKAKALADDPFNRTTDREVGPAERLRQKLVQRSGSLDALGLGNRQGLPVAQDRFGRPVENPRQGMRAITPRIVQPKDDPLARVFGDAKVEPGLPPKAVTVSTYGPDGKVAQSFPMRLTDAEQREWNRLRGEALQGLAGKLADDPAWSAQPRSEQERYLKIQMEVANAYASRKVRESFVDNEIRRRITPLREVRTR